MFLSKLFKRNAEAKEHLKDNRGDENVTKMIWVVIVFVVGALLLTIVSGAFSGKVADWYNDTTDTWFNESNGMYAIEGIGGGAGNGGAGDATQPQIGDVRTFTIKCHDATDDTFSDEVIFDKEFTYEYGMTWGEWITTNYANVVYDENIVSASPNPQNLFYCENNAIYVDDSYVPVYYEVEGVKYDVLSETLIDENVVYNAYLSWLDSIA